MKLRTIWTILEKEVFPIPLSSTLFNQYSHNNDQIDLPQASEIRKENLKKYLNSYTEKPEICLIGEAPGYKGCRFSGVPFTSEHQLTTRTLSFSGLQSSIRAQPYTEQTATVFWKVLRPYFPKFFIWNCIPIHPHKDGQYLSNRSPTILEIQKYGSTLEKIISNIVPEVVIAIGKNPKKSLDYLHIRSERVRHPAHGGSEKFEKEILKFFRK